MKLTKCAKKHYYNSDKFESCPHCANMVAANKGIHILGVNQANVATEDIYDIAPIENQFVTGWLVCIKGEMIGCSFSLHEGNNHIGRASHMDISLYKEPTVSRQNHAQILYSTLEHTFILSSNTKSKVFLNNQELTDSKTLQNRDVITLGSCQLVFVPFCNQEFTWNNQ